MTNDLNGQQPRPVVAGELGQLFQPTLLPRLRENLRLRHYSLKAEKAYVQWVRRHVHFHGKRHPPQMGALLASVRYGDQTRMAGLWWKPTYKSHSHGIANGGSRCIPVVGNSWR